MKCDELKAYNVVATADVNPEVVDSLGCTEWTGYDKNDVDVAIAELKAENRKLKRALWLARAKRAHAEKHWTAYVEYVHIHEKSSYRVDGDVIFRRDNRNIDTFRKWIKRWTSVERKCRTKAEEYK